MHNPYSAAGVSVEGVKGQFKEFRGQCLSPTPTPITVAMK